jgi:hypothetical protein
MTLQIIEAFDALGRVSTINWGIGKCKTLNLPTFMTIYTARHHVYHRSALKHLNFSLQMTTERMHMVCFNAHLCVRRITSEKTKHVSAYTCCGYMLRYDVHYIPKRWNQMHYFFSVNIAPVRMTYAFIARSRN